MGSMACDHTWDDLWDAEPFERIDKISAGGRLVPIRDPLQSSLSKVCHSTSQVNTRDHRLLWYHHGPNTDKITRSPRDEKPVPVQERKRCLLEDLTSKLLEQMERFAEREMSKLNASRSIDECWLHPKPTGYVQVIAKPLTWRSRDGRIHDLAVHLGFMILLLANLSDPLAFPISEEQKAGYINDAWHLSHLCGNWTCLNPRHFTVESKTANVTRNKCFRHSHGCGHTPKCLKQFKRPLRGLRPALFTCEELDRASTLLFDTGIDLEHI